MIGLKTQVREVPYGCTRCNGIENCRGIPEKDQRIPGDDLHDVRLFGSQVRNEAHGESDLDVFVLVDRYDREWRSRIIDLAYEVNMESDFVVPLSPLVMDEHEFSLYCSRERRLALDILREGVPL